MLLSFQRFLIAKQLLVTLALLPLAASLANSPPSDESLTPSLRVRSLDLPESAASQPIVQTLHGPDGFIWVATESELYRFDGARFARYTSKLTDASPSKDFLINQVFSGPDGQLWVSTRQDYLRFDSRSDSFRVIEGASPGQTERPAIVGPHKRLWKPNLRSGLEILELKGDRLVAFETEFLKKHGIAKTLVRAVCFSPNGDAFIALGDNTLLQAQVTPESIELKANLTIELPAGAILQSLHADRHQADTLWIGTNASGIIRQSLNPPDSRSYLRSCSNGVSSTSALDIQEFLQDPHDRLWARSGDQGLLLYAPSSDRFQRVPSLANPLPCLRGNQLRSICLDREGNLWLGYMGGELSYVSLSPSQSRYLHVSSASGLIEPADNRVSCYLKAKDGSEWYGTRSQGLFRQNAGQISHFYLEAAKGFALPSNSISCLLEGRDGRIWIGFEDNGISVFDPTTLSIRQVSPENVAIGYKVRSLLETDYALWVCSSTGVSWIDPQTLLPLATPELFPKRSASIAISDSAGRVWIGSNAGLYVYDPSSHSLTSKPNDETPDRITDRGSITGIHEMPDRTLWVSAYGKGMLKFDSNLRLVATYGREQGMPDPNVCSFQVGDNGRLYIATRSGIVLLDPASGHIERYSKADGIPNDHFIVASSQTLGDGSILFANEAGLLKIHPKDLRTSLKALTPRFVDLQILDPSATSLDTSRRSLVDIPAISLEPYQNIFTLSFSALNYERLAESWFQYRIKELSEDWSTPSLERTATFANLPAGTYTIELRASNSPQFWSNETATLQIAVLPSLWQNWWIKLTAALLLAIAIYVVSHVRILNVEKKRKKLEKLVSQRTAEVEARNAEILKKNRELEYHQTHLEQLVQSRTADLEKVKNQAIESDKQKSAFLANMSHEIRTPLNSIVGFSRILPEEETYSKEDRKEFATIIESNAATLTRLIDDILDISKLDSAQLKLQVGPCDLIEMCQRLHRIYRKRLGENNPQINMQLELPQLEELTIETDPQRIEQIIVNFLDNASKFTTKGSIELKLTQKKREIEISVTDTGIGISENDQETIFERFIKSDERRDEIRRGAGLGLAISKKLAALLGGSIKVQSAPGKGSTFTLHLASEIISLTPPQPAKRPIPQRFNWAGRNLLIAEDEEANYLLLYTLCKPTGITIAHAKNGREAIEAIKGDTPFDLVLMDLQMPQVNGIDATQEIKKLRPDLPIIAHTAHTMLHNRQSLLEKGFDDYISKPINAHEALSLINAYLSNS